MQGQTSVLLLTSFMLTFICLIEGRDIAAGLCLGLGLFKFPVVLPFALIWALQRNWKLIAGFVLTGSGLVAASLIATGPAGALGYIRLLLDQAKHPEKPAYLIDPKAMINVRGFLGALWPSAFGSSSLMLAIVVVCALLIFWAARALGSHKERDGDSFRLAFAGALVISEVTAFHTLLHDLSPVILAIVLAVSSYRWTKPPSWRQPLGAAVATLYLLPMCLAQVSTSAMWLLTPLLAVFGIIALRAEEEASAKAQKDATAPWCTEHRGR